MPVTEIDPATAHRQLQEEPGAVYLDVRSVPEYDEGHPTGAWNIPLLHATAQGMRPNPDFQRVAAAVLPKDVLLAVGCRSGQRSAMACRALHDMGLARAVNVAGGFASATDMLGRVIVPGWEACGLPSTMSPTSGKTWDELRAQAGG